MENQQSFPRICIIGAGLSGLCMAIQLKTKLNMKSFTIYEAREEVGGTWLVNTYPGCACDIPSHLYSYSFTPKYDWSYSYSPQPEILEYIKNVAKTYGIYSFIRFHIKVKCVRWDGQANKWHAIILNTITNLLEQTDFDIIINGTGKLRIPYYPSKYLKFQGTLVHSADWNSNISLQGKRVGIIGTGASAVQIIIAIASQVKQLTIFQRNAPVILPRHQFKHSSAMKWALDKVSGFYKLSRYLWFWLHEMMFPATKYNSLLHKAITHIANWYRNRQIGDPILKKKATPKYAFGCKRVILSENYYTTLNQDNVELVTEKISKVEGKEIHTSDGASRQLDVLILATGFQVHDFFAPMRVYGLKGIDVLEKWKRTRPRAYMGILDRDMPNFFTLLGPYTASGHNSNIFNIECQVDWTILVIKLMMEKLARRITITKDAEEKFMRFIDQPMKNTVWVNGNCKPWYFDEKGVNTMIWPHSHIEFWKRCRAVDENMFQFLY